MIPDCDFLRLFYLAYSQNLLSITSMGFYILYHMNYVLSGDSNCFLFENIRLENRLGSKFLSKVFRKSSRRVLLSFLIFGVSGISVDVKSNYLELQDPGFILHFRSNSLPSEISNYLSCFYYSVPTPASSSFISIYYSSLIVCSIEDVAASIFESITISSLTTSGSLSKGEDWEGYKGNS